MVQQETGMCCVCWSLPHAALGYFTGCWDWAGTGLGLSLVCVMSYITSADTKHLISTISSPFLCTTQGKCPNGISLFDFGNPMSLEWRSHMALGQEVSVSVCGMTPWPGEECTWAWLSAIMCHPTAWSVPNNYIHGLCISVVWLMLKYSWSVYHLMTGCRAFCGDSKPGINYNYGVHVTTSGSRECSVHMTKVRVKMLITWTLWQFIMQPLWSAGIGEVLFVNYLDIIHWNTQITPQNVSLEV